MTSRDIETLRKAVKHRMVDLDLDRPGSMAVMSQDLAARLGRPVNRNCLVMALTGYRSGPAAQELLIGLHDMLSKRADSESQKSEYAHHTE